MEEDLTRLQEEDPIVFGVLNATIRLAQNPRSQQVADLLMEFSLVDLLHHFQKSWRFHHMKSWSQILRGRFLCTRFYIILGVDLRQVRMVEIRDMRNYSSDYFTLRAILLQSLMWCHVNYLQVS